MASVNVPEIIGLPPISVNDPTYDMMRNSMPIATFRPAVPKNRGGISTFGLDVRTGWQKYTTMLNQHGITYQTSTSKSVKLAFVADNFPTDTFTNEYGESFLERMSNVVSSGISDISQMVGSRTGTQTIENLAKSFEAAGKQAGGVLGTFVEGTAGSAASAVKGVNALAKSLGKVSPNIASQLSIINRSLAGGRVDFPHVWKGSSFNPSYTMTVKLINPYPGNDDATMKYIVGPLVVILALGLPQSEDGKVFSWPFFQKVKCKGLYEVPAAVITSITVIKGGDQQQISWNQRPSIVDVRIDFTSLYTIMMVNSGKTNTNNLERPTLHNYIQVLSSGRTLSAAEIVQTKPKPANHISTTRSSKVAPRISPQAQKAEQTLLNK